jgi:hypothetical protein
VYSIADAALSAFSVFFTQSPSFLAHQQLMHERTGKDNARSFFGMHQIPTNNCIRDLLDPVGPEHCFSVYVAVQKLLSQWGTLKREYRYAGLDSYLIALDGTGFHRSERIHCDQCSVKKHQDGRVSYSHSAITPVFVRPAVNRVIAVEPEFITPQDGESKQDCEVNAAKRWIGGAGAGYASLGVTLLGDDLYAKQPFCEDAAEAGFHYLFTCKASSHKYLYEWVEAGEVGVEITEVVHKRWDGKQRLYERYRFMNDVPIRDGDDALRVNWCELAILDEQQNLRKRFGFLTDHRICPHTVVALVEAGRSRWKIENEHNNTLKTKGYNLEHNFGHGTRHLANLLLTLNLIAFLFHTVLELFDARYRLLRTSLGRRATFFNDIRALTRYHYYDSWQALLCFMIERLELSDPGG